MIRGIIGSALLLITVFITVFGCARQAAPTGGPADEDPPVVVKSLPSSGVTNFSGNRIEVTFNEFVVFDKLNEKFMISPPTGIKPDISLRGKTMIIGFREKLRDSTTYTLYFQDAIKDLNEGNPLNNYQFVFSTGNYIDSLSVTGNVVMAEDLEAGKNILVMLHRELADSAPAKLLPDYITLADVNGAFRIDNIHEGDYRMFALSDNNNNKKYDLADEPFAFYDSVININPLTDFLPVQKDTVTVRKKPGDKTKPEVPYIDGAYKLFMFTPERNKYYLTSSSRKSPYQLVYTLSLPPGELDTEFSLPGNEGTGYFTERSRGRDTLTVWLRDSLLYSQPQLKTLFSYPFTDSTGRVIPKQDTVIMRFVTQKPSRTRQVRSAFRYSTNIAAGGLKPGQHIVFTGQTPFRRPDTSLIRLFDVSSKQKTPMPYRLEPDTLTVLRYHFHARLKEEGKYLLVTDSASFGNIYGEVCDSAAISFAVRSSKSYGQLTLDARSGNSSLLIQLLSNKEKLLGERKLADKGKVDFTMLEPGFYRVRAVFDLNNDGKWTPGNYHNRLQPEPVTYFPREIEIKADWEIIEEWDLSLRNFKDRSLTGKKEQD